MHKAVYTQKTAMQRGGGFAKEGGNRPLAFARFKGWGFRGRGNRNPLPLTDLWALSFREESAAFVLSQGEKLFLLKIRETVTTSSVTRCARATFSYRRRQSDCHGGKAASQ